MFNSDEILIRIKELQEEVEEINEHIRELLYYYKLNNHDNIK